MALIGARAKKNYTIEEHIIQSYFGFNIGSIESNYADLLLRKKNFYLKNNSKNEGNFQKKYTKMLFFT